jgi:hypothetical protein
MLTHVFPFFWRPSVQSERYLAVSVHAFECEEEPCALPGSDAILSHNASISIRLALKTASTFHIAPVTF